MEVFLFLNYIIIWRRKKMYRKMTIIVLSLCAIILVSCSLVLADEVDFLMGSGGRVVLDGDIIIGSKDRDRIMAFEEDNPSITAANFEVNFEKWDELASGDINNDGVDEIIHGDKSKDWIRIYTNSGTLLRDHDVGFQGGDDLEAGDVQGDGNDIIVHADRSDDTIRFFDMNGELSSFYLDFEDGDRIGVGDVNGDGAEEIIHGDKDEEYIRVYNYNGDLLYEFESDFQARDGLQAGDINMDGIAEIVHADRSTDMIYIYDVEGTELGTFYLDFEKGDGLAVGDINMDGVEEIVHADRSDDLRVYDMNGDLLLEFGVEFDEGDSLAIGDTDADSLLVGNPIHSEQTIAGQVIAIINAPPKHLGIINDSGVFYTTYENEVGQTTSQSLKTTADFALSMKMKSEFGIGISKVKTSLSSKLAMKWEREKGTSFTQTIGNGLTADLKDRMVHITTHYDVYEFPILKPSHLAIVDGEQQYIMAAVPQAPPTITLDDYDSPIHTEGDIRTYPDSMGQLLGYKTSNQLDNIEFVVSADPSSAWLELSQTQFESNKDTTSFEMGLGVSVSAGITGFGKGSFSVNAEFGSESVSTHKVSITEQKSMKVNYEGGITDEDKTYTVRSVMYYDDETGALIIDYIIPTMGSYYDTNLMFGQFNYGDMQGFYGNIFGGQISNGSGYTIDGTVLSIESSQSSPGNTVQLPIEIINAENIGNMDISLTYDPEVLTANELTKGAITSDSLFVHNIQPGIVNISLVDDAGITGNGSIAHIKFNVTGEKGDACPLILSAVANDDNADSVDLEIMNALFSIEDEESLKGDVNGDGKVNSADALLALKMAVGILQQNAVADMNDDGSVTSLDAAEILETGTDNAVIDVGYQLMGYSDGIKPRFNLGG